MRKTYKYRLYPTRSQAEALDDQLGEARRLYNAALQERRDAWRTAGLGLNYYDQANQLKQIRAEGGLDLANFSAAQDVLRRVDKTYKAFFRRVKSGKGKAGFPRFKGRDRFDSYTFPSYGDGVRLLGSGKLRVQGVGHIKTKLHRPVEGEIKTVTLRREAGKWFTCLSVTCEPRQLPESTEAVGMDAGLSVFATLSDGTEIENPRYYRESERKLRIAQRKVARRKKRSRRRRKAVRELQAAHAHIRNQRSDFHHKLACWLVARFGLIAIEDLNVKGLAGGMLAKSVHDVGWSAFFGKLAYKAEGAGRELVRVDPRGTSQTCLCGERVPKDLSQRWHECPGCGLSLRRDHVAALLILRLGLSLRAPSSALAGFAREAVCFS